MSATTSVLRAASGNRRISLLRISASYPAHSRTFHVSHAALKKKGKAVQNDTLFNSDSDSDADELFSASTSAPKSQPTPTKPSKPEPLPQRRVSPSKETSLVDEKAAEELRLKEEQRRDDFQSSYEYLFERTGDAGKQSSALPSRRALHTLVKLAISQEEWQRVIATFRQWRRYPARPVPSSIQHLFIERGISTGQAPLVVNILTHHPIYGIHISSLPLARALLKHLITPVNGPPPFEVDLATHRERLDLALRLAQVFSISTIPLPAVSPSPGQPPGSTESVSPAATSQVTQTTEDSTHSKAITLSPSNDLILGSLLLSALLRASCLPPSTYSTKPKTDSAEPTIPTITTDPSAVALAARELLISLRASPSYSQSTDQEGGASGGLGGEVLSGKEALWCVAALSECMVLLGGKNARKVFDGIESVEDEVKMMNVDQMITWLGKARGWLMQSSSERGGVVRGKMEAVVVKDGSSGGLAEGKGAVGSHMLGPGDGQMAETRA